MDKCSLKPEWAFQSTRQSINESANFRFLQRLSVIFGFHRDCPRSLASCRDCCAWEIASCRDCPCVLASCRDPRQEAESHEQSLQEAIFSWTVVSAGSKRSRTVSAEAKYDGQSLQEAKVSGLVYACKPVNVAIFRTIQVLTLCGLIFKFYNTIINRIYLINIQQNASPSAW